MLEVLIYILILLFIVFFFGSAAYAGWRAAPWLPAFKKDMERIIKLAELKDDDLVYDLGSGDGRVVIALANNSRAQFVGYEISLIMYCWSRLKIFFSGLGKRVEIRCSDFLTNDLSQATVIFCFLTPMAMKKLSIKFQKELKKGTRIVSYSFSLPDWQPLVTDKPDTTSIPIYKYIVD